MMDWTVKVTRHMFSILMAKNTKISNNMKTGIVGKHIVVM
jgi:hypothetical protein